MFVGWVSPCFTWFHSYSAYSTRDFVAQSASNMAGESINMELSSWENQPKITGFSSKPCLPDVFSAMNLWTQLTTDEEIIWLVVWNMTFIFPYIGNFIIPTDELSFFRGVGLNHQPDMLLKWSLPELDDGPHVGGVFSGVNWRHPGAWKLPSGNLT